ncbi:MAG: hypothetical protein J6R83_00825 [Clostridia bacterium]|nr:hypothetical protein [Clostridia bacterium]
MPIFLNLKVVFPIKAKKLYFSIKIFGFIPLFSGYVYPTNVGLYIQFFRKKGLILPYKKIFNVRNTIKLIKDFQVTKLSFCLDIGFLDNEFTAYTVATALNNTSNIVGATLKYNKPYMRYYSQINVYSENLFNIYLSLNVMFNFLLVIIQLIKYILEKFINVFRFKKQQN